MATKIYNVVVSVNNDGNFEYNNVRSFKSFEGARKGLSEEYKNIKSMNDIGEYDIDDFDEESDKEIAWFDLELYQYNYYAAGSVFVCDVED